MGPYMRPIPVGASAAMFWSLLIAFIVTPWASVRILRWGKKYSSLTEGVPSAAAGDQPHLHSEHPEDFFTKLYRRVMNPLLHSVKWRWSASAG